MKMSRRIVKRSLLKKIQVAEDAPWTVIKEGLKRTFGRGEWTPEEQYTKCLRIDVDRANGVVSGSFSVSKAERAENNYEELRKLERGKYVEYNSNIINNILKNFFVYIKTHYSRPNETADLKYEYINENKGNFVFNELKGKLYPKHKPIYMDNIQPPVGSKKYFEISGEKKIIHIINLNLKYNESRKVETFNHKNTSVIGLEIVEPEAKNKEEASSLSVKSSFSNNTVGEISSSNVSETSEYINFYTNQEFYYNISKSSQFILQNGNELDNYAKGNAIDKVAKSYKPITHPSRLSLINSTSLQSLDMDYHNSDIKIKAHVAGSESIPYLSENEISKKDPGTTSICCEEPPKRTSLNVSDVNQTKKGEGTKYNTNHLSTTQKYDSYSTPLPYSYLSYSFDDKKSQVIIKSDSKSTIEITKGPSDTDVSRETVIQNHLLSPNLSISSIRPDQSITSYPTILVKTFTHLFRDFSKHIPPKFNYTSDKDKDKIVSNKPYHLEQNNYPTKENLQTDLFSSSSVIEFSNSPSTILNVEYSFDSDNEANKSSKTSIYSYMPLVTNENEWNHSTGQSKYFSFFTPTQLFDKTTGYSNDFNFSTDTKGKTISTAKYNDANGLKPEASQENTINTLDAIRDTKAQYKKGIYFLNYTIKTTEKDSLEKSTFISSTSSNISDLSNALFNFTMNIPMKEDNPEPITLGFYNSSPNEETTIKYTSDYKDSISADENRSSPKGLFDNRNFGGKNNTKTKLNYDEISTSLFESLIGEVTNYSTDFSKSSLHSIGHEPLDIQSHSPEFKTTKSVSESNTKDLPLFSSYVTSKEDTEGFSKDKQLFSSSLANLPPGLPADKTRILITTPMDLLTGDINQNGDLYTSKRIEWSTTPTIIENLENNSNKFFPPHISSSFRDFDSSYSTGQETPQSEAFSQHSGVNYNNEKATSTGIFFPSTSTFHSHLKASSPVQSLSSSFEGVKTIERATIKRENLQHLDFSEEPKYKTNSTTLEYVIKNNNNDFIKPKTNDDFMIRSTMVSVTETVADETVSVNNAENITSPGNIENYDQLTVSSVTSPVKNIYTTELKGSLDGSIIEKPITLPNIVFSATDDINSHTTIREKSDIDIKSSDYESTENVFGSSVISSGSNVDPKETTKLTSGRDPSFVTVFKPHYLTRQGMFGGESSEIATTEIYNYISKEQLIPLKTHTLRYVDLSNYSKESDIVSNKENSNMNWTTSLYSTKNKPNPYTEKYNNKVNTIQNNNISIKEKKDDIFRATLSSIIATSNSKIYDSIENFMSDPDLGVSTEHYPTMPSFNNFTFLLPTTDYLTSYLPVRVRPLIFFSEI